MNICIKYAASQNNLQSCTKNKYVYGLGKTGNSVKLLLDPEKLIKDEDIAAFEEMTEQNEEQ